ncbi:MAG: sensor histidine kinase [Chloroflexota bacterium]
MSLPLRARIFLGLVVLAAAGMQAYWWRAQPAGPRPGLTSGDLGFVVGLVALAVVAQHFPVVLGPGRKADVSIALYFADLLLLGPAAAVSVVGVSQALGQGTLALRRDPTSGRRRRGVRFVLFNTSQLMVATGLSGLVYRVLLSGRAQAAPVSLTWAEQVWAVPALAATLYLANSALVATMVGLQRGRSPMDVWLTGRGRDALEAAGLLLIGFVAARAAARDPWILPLLIICATVIQRSLARAAELAQRAAEANSLRDVARLKDEFLSTISHELRTPLTIVYGYAELLHVRRASLDPVAARMAEQLYLNAAQLTQMVDDLLDLTRIERGELAVHPGDVDLVPVLHQVVTSLRDREGGERLMLAVPPLLPGHADPSRVAQVLTNLVANALKYAPTGPIVVRARAVAGAAGMIRIEVEDRGPGIPPEEQPHVWEKFYRGTAVSGRANVAGTGIGLAVVKMLVEAQGGRVGLRSTPGKGTCFWFDLPKAGARRDGGPPKLDTPDQGSVRPTPGQRVAPRHPTASTSP